VAYLPLGHLCNSHPWVGLIINLIIIMTPSLFLLILLLFHLCHMVTKMLQSQFMHSKCFRFYTKAHPSDTNSQNVFSFGALSAAPAGRLPSPTSPNMHVCCSLYKITTGSSWRAPRCFFSVTDRILLKWNTTSTCRTNISHLFGFHWNDTSITIDYSNQETFRQILLLYSSWISLCLWQITPTN